jgi:hypothetical protein
MGQLWHAIGTLRWQVAMISVELEMQGLSALYERQSLESGRSNLWGINWGLRTFLAPTREGWAFEQGGNVHCL